MSKDAERPNDETLIDDRDEALPSDGDELGDEDLESVAGGWDETGGGG